MPKPFIGVRWWLGVAFAVVAATSTAIVVAQFSDRSENAFRRHGESLALHDAQAAARKNVTPTTLDRVARELQGNVSLKLFAPTGSPAGASALVREAVSDASAGENVVKATPDGGTFVAAIPYHGQVLVAISPQPATAEAIDTVRCVDDGVLTSTADANIGSIYGIGFPAWTGGGLQCLK